MMIKAELDPTSAKIRQAQIASRLADALNHKGLQVAYQPEFDLRTRQIVSLEALCRWHDDKLGTVSPDEFIAVAEARGLITLLGQYMLNQVLTDLPAVLQLYPQARVAVNVSGVELSLSDFALRTGAAIRHVDPSLAKHIELEVTESVLHHDLPTVSQNLIALRNMQITIAIDDFGTGQSSLARLHILPFDKIKLDRSFVQALEDPMVQEIVRAMAQLAEKFSRTLVVEGLETPAQLKQLMQLGCHLAQGYLLCAPCSLKELANAVHWPK